MFDKDTLKIFAPFIIIMLIIIGLTTFIVIKIDWKKEIRAVEDIFIEEVKYVQDKMKEKSNGRPTKESIGEDTEGKP